MPKLNLSARFTLILSAVFLVGTLIGGSVYWRALQGNAQDEIATQGLLLIETMNAVRGYTSLHVKPLLAERLASSETFISETVPAYSARSVFQNFRDQVDFETYLYKEASDNPTNPLDRADEFESALLTSLAAGSEAEARGYRDIDGARYYYIARPLRIGADSCLECHSDPESAPASLLATYGDQGGFGWTLGQLVAVQVIYVPAEEVFNAAWRTFSVVMSVFVVLFGLIILLINFLLRRYVIQPVKVMGALAQKISVDENFSVDLDSPAFMAVTTRSDELGNLANVFRKMAADVYARTGKLKEQIQQLIIKIDETRRKEQVAEVVETEFFNDLQKRAEEFRKRGAQGDGTN
jgi:methyl-accepting chemotaxis protein